MGLTIVLDYTGHVVEDLTALILAVAALLTAIGSVLHSFQTSRELKKFKGEEEKRNGGNGTG